jgi:hypothetical protein
MQARRLGFAALGPTYRPVLSVLATPTQFTTRHADITTLPSTAAPIAVATAQAMTAATVLEEVVFCCFSRGDFEVYQGLLSGL